MNIFMLTDEYGKARSQEDLTAEERLLIPAAMRYFGDVIEHLERKKPAMGTFSGRVYPDALDARPDMEYKPRISFERYSLTPQGKIDLLLYASYARHSLSVRYTEDDGFDRWYDINIEWPAVIRDEAGYGFYGTRVRTQKEVIDAIRYRLRPKR